MPSIHHLVATVASAFEFIGVLIIVLGLVYAVYVALSDKKTSPYTSLRQVIGKSILLGLEVLVAADIIMTVTTEPTIDRLLALGLVVLIRTFLSLSLEVELTGRWPWNQAQTAPGEHEVMGS